MAYPSLVTPSLFLEIWAGKTNSGFPKTLLGRYLFVIVEYLSNCSPKWRKKIQKPYFSFNCCKLAELHGCFTPFNFSELLYMQFFTSDILTILHHKICRSLRAVRDVLFKNVCRESVLGTKLLLQLFDVRKYCGNIKELTHHKRVC